MTLVLLLSLLAGAAAPAAAYLDPGSGSMLVQLAAAGFAGLVVLIKLYWKRLKAKVSDIQKLQ
ncbi:MAG: hypothetical protein HYV15_07140 [Elusimicrobia bacterium]|nr:hypothetical protein [Elusimicrobiota bacterium]